MNLYVCFASDDQSVLGDNAYSDVNDLSLFFIDVIDEAFFKFVPKFNNYIRNVKRYPAPNPPRLEGDIIEDINIKHKLLKKKKLPSQFYDLQLKVLSSPLHKKIKRNYGVYVKSVESGISADPQTFLCFVNRDKKEYDYPRIMHLDDTLLEHPIAIVNTFA